MTARVLDSWALMAFYQGEPAAEEVGEILFRGAQGRYQLFLGVFNWTEIYTAFLRGSSASEAEAKAREITSLSIQVIGVGDDLRLARQAAIFKARGGISHGDAFAAALAKDKKADLVTGDPEFKRLEKDIKIHWLI